MIRVYYTQANVENISPTRLESWIETGVASLPAVKREQIQRLRPLSGRLNSTLGWHLVQFAFRHSGYTAFKLSELQFPDKQKPRWPQQNGDFNLSHSHILLACVLSDTGPVGIDVEFIRPLRDDAMFRQILTAEESVPADADYQLFFQYWTRKEAVIKAEGSGGVWDMRFIRLHASYADYKNSRWELYPLHLLPGYAACVASNRNNEEIYTEEVAIDRLLTL